jgi:hypothetical protein
MIAAKEPNNLVTNCIASAKEALNQLDADVVEVTEAEVKPSFNNYR